VNVTLQATDLKKVFNRRIVFQHLSLSVSSGQTLLIGGRNGSGKSTLVRILCNVLVPSAGTVALRRDDAVVNGLRQSLIGLVAPYLSLYDEFTPKENLSYALAIRGLRKGGEAIDSLLERFSLDHRADDEVRTFSSGMKQRLKFAFALIHSPPVLILDEPMTNLDKEGIRVVQEVMAEQAQRGALVVATNDRTDVHHWTTEVNLDEHK
jgi:heme exporter protein A